MAQTRSEIVAAMEHGDYVTAYCGFRYYAELGDADAQTYLGHMYYNGDGVSQDYAQAAKWYLRAAEQGDAFAQHVLAAMYDEGLGISHDYVQAYKWFDVAASRFKESQEASAFPQLSQSMEGLVTLYRDQVALKLSTAQLARAKRLAREWRPRTDAGSPPTRTWRAAVAAYEHEDYGTAYCGFREQAAQGDTHAQYNLGVMYYYGQGIPQDYAEASRWFRRSAEQDNADAQTYLGRMYYDGHGFVQDHSKAANWFRRAAEQGSVIANAWLGVMNANRPATAQTLSEGVTAAKRGDHVTAYRVFRHHAEQGDADAQAFLGATYDEGLGVPQNHSEAAKWYGRAARQGHAEAQFSLGVLHYGGVGVRQDYGGALTWYRRAAEQGHDGAQYNLGLMHYNGIGVPQSHADARPWFLRAAEQGHARSQFILGLMYYLGQGVSQDYTAAAQWYSRAAEQHDADAKFYIGLMYYHGEGYSRSYVDATRWFVRAAEQGHARSQFVLGLMYDEGLGVPQDYVRAHKWYNLAASRFHESEQREAAVRYRDQVALRLSPDQLAYAQRLAREWRPVDASDSPTPAPLPPDQSRPVLEEALTGSGFRVSAQGHFLTNAHVVRGCAEVQVPPASSVRVVAYDDAADLAILEAPSRTGTVAAFRQGRGIRAGASVMVLGYPLHGIVSSETIVSAGVVSALAGPGDDRRLIQITAPVQPGNSGGPALDSAGNVVGVVVSKLNALKIARETGDIPQNVNFAVAAGAARAFLDAEGVPYLTAPSDTPLAPDQVAAVGKEFTVLVECWKPKTRE